MALRLGTTLHGSKYSFRLVEKLGDKTVFNPVFKAEVLPGVQSILPRDRWAVVKSAVLENQTQVDCLVKEYKYYKKPSIESSRNFRKLCDIINDPIGWTAQKPFCLAFEWMDTTYAHVKLFRRVELFGNAAQNGWYISSKAKYWPETDSAQPTWTEDTTLAEVPFGEHMKDPVLVADIVKVCLADLKPANVLISSVDGLSKVKIGDLGLAGPEGGNPRWVQPEAFRAPEVWTGVSCYHKADVWSIAAMMLQRFDPNILGNADNIDKTRIHPMAWCLAKIILLFDPSCNSIPPPDVDKTLQAYFKLAQNLTTTQAKEDLDELLLQIPSFEVWADLAMDAGIPKVVLDVIRLLAVPNPMNRPSALQALQSPEYKALQKAAAAYVIYNSLLRSGIR
ncbi:hypothetical protein SBOR_7354 [Sclerotinia borealis F-4128]|uniref:Protein kinase domain-containing protein n=1 Tax=Sclerotinia borealis (strain F-4128) TaxID=1432307 RepID=W9CCI7_SCLBF|nr:hypothetical protein SBOR_7354 [Sclerotinia borealis F-4128]